jgi:hypothetical protein
MTAFIKDMLTKQLANAIDGLAHSPSDRPVQAD